MTDPIIDAESITVNILTDTATTTITHCNGEKETVVETLVGMPISIIPEDESDTRCQLIKVLGRSKAKRQSLWDAIDEMVREMRREAAGDGKDDGEEKNED